MEISRHRWLIGLILGGVFISAGSSWSTQLQIATISSEPAEDIKKFHPFTMYLANQLHAEGITEGRVVMGRNIGEMAVMLKNGRADLYIDSAFPTIAVSRQSGSKLLLRRWKKELAEYHTVIFTKSSTAISDVNGLKGKMIAFEEPTSTSGYLVPKLALTQQGLKLVLKTSPTDPVAKDEVGYVFSNDDENTMLFVVRGRVAAAATDNQTFLKEAHAEINNLRVLHRTFALPRHLVSYRADLAPRLVNAIKVVLSQMHLSEEGKKILVGFERTSKFDEIPEPLLAPLLKAGKFIDAEVKSQ